MPFALSGKYGESNAAKIEARNRSIAALRALPIPDVLRQGGSDLEQQVIFGLQWYRGTVITRLRLLERGASDAYNSNNLMCAAILVRQMVETAAHFISSWQYEEKQLQADPPNLQGIYDKVLRRLFGSKRKDVEQGLLAENILNSIDDTDALVKRLFPEVWAKRNAPIRACYDDLSEFVHPNSDAFQFHWEPETSGEFAAVTFHMDGSEMGWKRVPGMLFLALVILDLFLRAERQFSAAVVALQRLAAKED